MTQQEMQIAIAEAVKHKKQRNLMVFKPAFGFAHQLNYNSLDSMQQAVLAQDEEFQAEFDKALYLRSLNKKGAVGLGNKKLFHQLTVLDWQTAFVETLKALGRLK